MSDMVLSALKRIAAFLIGLVFITLDKKLGLELSETVKAEVVALVLGFITQSFIHSAIKAKLDAAAAVPDVDAAVKVLDVK